MKKGKKALTLLLIFTLALSLFPQSAQAAKKKKVKLSKKTVTVKIGKTVKLKLKNNKKKVKWTVISGKKNVTLSKKKKTGVTIKGKKPGTAKVQAKIGKKKYVCKVKVKKAPSGKKATNNSDKKTTQGNAGSTAAPTVSPSVFPSTTPQPTKVPDKTMLPPDVTPEPTVKPEKSYQGLYAEDQEFIVSSVSFEKEIENYYLSDNEIYVFQDEAESLKEVVPDVTKCDFTVYCYGKKAEVKSISDIMWNAKDAKGKGSYTFRVTAALDGKEYTDTVTMIMGRWTVDSPTMASANEVTLLKLTADGKEYELERMLRDRDSDDGYPIYYYFKDKDVDLNEISEAKEKTVTVLYEDEKITLDILNVGMSISGETYPIQAAAYERGKQLIVLDWVDIYKKVDDHFTIDAFTSTKGTVKYSESIGDGYVGFVYEDTIGNGKSLKDVFTDVSKELKIYRTIFNNAYCDQNAIRNVVWHEEPFYDSKEDHGYYTFDIVMTVDGEEITQSYWLVEKQKEYLISGKLKTEDGLPIANAEAYRERKDVEDGYPMNRYIETDSEGNFTTKVPKGSYQFNYGKTFTVEKDITQYEETLPVYKISGSIKRTDAQSMDLPAVWFMASEPESGVLYMSDVDDENKYYVYLKKGSYKIDVDYNTIQGMQVTASKVYDITLNMGKVAGKASKSYCFKNTDTGDTKYSISDYGKYVVFLTPGTYEVIDEDTVIDTIEVTLGDMKKDYVMHSCKGKILDLSGVEIPKEVYRPSGYEIAVLRNGSRYRTLNIEKGDGECSGNYELTAVDGEYEFFYGNTSVGKVTIDGSDVTQDLTMPLKYTKIKLLDAENNIIPLEEDDYLTLTPQFAGGESSQVYMGGTGYSGHVALVPGSYQLTRYDRIMGIEQQTITVTEENDVVSVETGTYKVSGNCLINGGDSSEDVYIELCEASNYTNMITCAVRDGKYAVYVPTGKYRCSVRNLEGSLADENITVTDMALEKNYDLTVGSLSGKVTWENGSSFDANTPWGIYLENKDISFEGNITQDGSYKIPNITAYGTYDVTVIPLNGSDDRTKVGTVTINSETTEQDFVISGYLLQITLQDSTGEGKSFVNVTISGPETSPVNYECFTNFRGEISLIVSTPGTYEISVNNISCGNVTVTDKNVAKVIQM